MELKILIIEDDADTRELIEAYLADEPYELTMLEDGNSAIEYLKEEQTDIVVTDVRLPGLGGDKLVPFIHDLQPDLPIIVMTGYASVDGAVQFLHQGAFDYLTKPFTKHVLAHRIKLAARQVALKKEVDKLKDTARHDELNHILGNHPSMLRITAMLPSVAKTDAAVLVLGESGTGKEMMARAIHQLSNRHEHKFVALNCGALPEQLLESELFGYKKGAFTDAKQDRAGLVDEANMGTLFLDEVGEMSMTLQVKLLRFLQEKEYRPLGGNVTKKADVRIISATNKNLQQKVQEGTFREDLYYRLNVIPVQLPPLRERRSDVPVLINHYVKQFCAEYHRRIDGITPDLLAALVAYDWPGNVRELINTVQRLVIIAPGNILDKTALETISFMGALSSQVVPQVMNDTNSSQVTVDYSGSFKEEKEKVVSAFEKKYVRTCLEKSNNNISAAARNARMDRKNFWQLMKKYGIEAGPVLVD